MGSDGRSYVTGYFQLTLDGESSGLIQKFEGGDIEGEITQLPIAHKARSEQDLSLRIGLSMGQPVKDWIDASLGANPPRKSGELKVTDLHGKVQRVHEFEDALLTEIGFPALDGAAKDAATLSLRISPRVVRNKPGDGSVLAVPSEATRKALARPKYRFTVDGLEQACAKVSKVEAINIRQTQSDPRLASGKLRITLSEEYSHDFVRWHAGAARGDASQQRRGRLSYLDPATGDEFLALELENVTVTKIGAAPRSNNEDKIASVTVELYCENITSKFA